MSRKFLGKQQEPADGERGARNPAEVLPDADECWTRWVDLISQYGSCEVEPDIGVRVSATYDPSTTAQVAVTKRELHDYVSRWAESRALRGWDFGLEAGLPDPLIDGFVEGFGSQMEDSATYAIRGWDLKRIRGS